MPVNVQRKAAAACPGFPRAVLIPSPRVSRGFGSGAENILIDLAFGGTAVYNKSQANPGGGLLKIRQIRRGSN